MKFFRRFVLVFISGWRQGWKTTGQGTQPRIEIFSNSCQILTKTQAFFRFGRFFILIRMTGQWSLVSWGWPLRNGPRPSLMLCVSPMKWPSMAFRPFFLKNCRSITTQLILSWPVHVDSNVDDIALKAFVSDRRNTSLLSLTTAFNKGENHTRRKRLHVERPFSLYYFSASSAQLSASFSLCNRRKGRKGLLCVDCWRRWSAYCLPYFPSAYVNVYLLEQILTITDIIPNW